MKKIIIAIVLILVFLAIAIKPTPSVGTETTNSVIINTKINQPSNNIIDTFDFTDEDYINDIPFDTKDVVNSLQHSI